MSEEEGGTASSRLLLANLTVYGGATCVLFLIFCLIRNRFPSLYNPRNSPGADEKLRCELATQRFGIVNWIWGVLLCKEEDVVDQCGLDAACFLRVLKFGLKLSILGCVNALWLIPTYRTAPETEDNELVTDWFDKLSVANVNQNDPRLWGTVLSSYIFCAAAMYWLHLDFEWYIKQRHKNLSKQLPQNYVIFLSDIPPALGWSTALDRYFHKVFGNTVLQIDMFIKTKELDKDVAARKKLVAKLEHEIAKESAKHGSQAQLFGTGGIDALRGDLAQLTDKINKQVDDIEEQSRDREQRMEQVLEGIQEDDDDIGTEHSHAFRQASHLAAPPTGSRGRQVSSAVKSVAQLSAAPPAATDAAFVTFSSLLAANTALQVLHHGSPHRLKAARAPCPKDILWSNMGRPARGLLVTSLLSGLLTAITCVFWTIPVGFASTLVQVESLKARVSWLASASASFPQLDIVMGLLGPLVLIVFMSLLPAILTVYSELEGHVGRDALHASLFAKLASFMLIQEESNSFFFVFSALGVTSEVRGQVFFVASVGGALLKEVDELAQDPAGKILQVLSSTLPTQSVFYLNYFLVKVIVGAVVDLLRIVPAVMALIHKKMAPQLTVKERRTPWMGIKPLRDPGQFDEARPLATLVIVFVVLFVYMVLAPASSLILALGFALELVVWSNQFVFVYDPSNDTGGKLWPKFSGYVVVCMVISQVTILGYLGLKRGVMAPFMFPLLVATALFWQYLCLQHFKVAETLPMPRCHKADARADSADFDFVQDKYRQETLFRVSDDDVGSDLELASAHAPTPDVPQPRQPSPPRGGSVHPYPDSQDASSPVQITVGAAPTPRPASSSAGAQPAPRVSQGQGEGRGQAPASLDNSSYAIEMSQGADVKMVPVEAR